jgi:hypothetical protein
MAKILAKKQFSIFILLKNCKFEELYDSLKRVDSSLKIRFLLLSPKICLKNPRIVTPLAGTLIVKVANVGGAYITLDVSKCRLV